MGKKRNDLQLGLARGLCAAAALWAAGTSALAQTSHLPRSYAAEGYVTAVEGPNRFVVNGNVQVSTDATTYYEWFNHSDIRLGDATADSIEVGAYVEVVGKKEKKSVTTHLVRVQDEGERKIHGFGLVDKVIAHGPEPVFRADGYLLRIGPNTETTFSGGLKTLDDVKPNTWVRYEGRRDKTGDLVAARAEFVPGIPGKIKTVQVSQSSTAPDAIPPRAKIIDSNGKFEDAHAKVRFGDSRGWCGWHLLATDKALQERVWRVGMSVVPALQKQMAPDDAARINFRFYAVDESNIRTEFLCKEGVILVPQQVAGRMRNDDELSAVLADGVAFSLQSQERKVSYSAPLRKSAMIAEDALMVYDPLDFVVVDKVIVPLAMRSAIQRAEEQRGRLALALMADAGYDPKLAPEAWRLLVPKDLPVDLDSLRYPNRSGYQLAILSLQYKRDEKSGAASAAVAPAQ